MKNVTIIGAGAWGTALAYMFKGTGLNLTIWSKNESIVKDINNNNINSKYAGKISLSHLEATTDLENSLKKSDVIINALPSYAIKGIFANAKSHINKNTIIINGSKGMDTKTHQMPHQVFNEILHSEAYYYSLSGPGFAAGVMNNNPTTINIAGKDHNLIKLIKTMLKKNNIYLAFSSDYIGVEWGGIYKNIVAIAAGFAEGLGFGENTSALIFSAGFKEMVQSGISMGANLETFYEPCGVGDLMLSTSSMKSRNFSLGYYLAKEPTLEAAFSKLPGIAEGYYTLQSISFLKTKYQLSLPLSNMLHEIIFEKAEHKKSFTKFLETHFK